MNPKVTLLTAFVQKIHPVVAKGKTAFRFGITMLLLQFLATSAGAQCTLGCNDNVLVSLDNSNCRALISVATISPMIQASCPGGNFQVVVMDLNGNVLPSSPYVTSADAGKKRMVKIFDLNSQNSCWGSVVVEDKIPPVFSNCAPEVVPCNADIYAPGVVTPPVVVDNCSGNVQLTFSDAITDFPCSNPNYTAMALRTYTATDQFGNSSSCVKTIYLRKGTLSSVVFPKNFDGIQQPVIDCTNANTDPSATGVPTVNGQPVNQYCDLLATYSDKISTGCAGAKIINRTWQVVEWCTGSQLNLVQYIKVEDKIKPLMVCPSDVTISTRMTGCTTNYTFPNFNPADNCSPVNKIIFQYTASNGTISGNSILNLPIGKTTVTVTESDDCGNKNFCTYNITVRDDIPPVAACSGPIKISLGLDGKAELSAAAIDNGSTDNCGIDRMEISKMGQTVNFQPKITFDCTDCNNSIQVILRVWDINGNYNDCMTSVAIEDKLNPQIVCPNNVTINCSQDYKDLNITGAAVASDNCSATAAYTDSVSLNRCGSGTVRRTWTATDKGGRTNSCVQTITIVNPKTIYINPNNPQDPADDVAWPADITVATCGTATLPTATGSPVISGDICNQTTTTFEDTEGTAQNGACKLILRKWKLTDFCQFDPNANPITGYWEYTQRISVLNSIPPAFSFTCQDVTLTLDAGNCVSQNLNMTLTATDDCTDTQNLVWFASVDLDNDGNVDRTINSGNISGSYPMGTSTINVTVSDGCGNHRSCNFKVLVVESQKPTAVCKQGLSANVDTTGAVTLDAKLFDGGSSDNCTKSADLTFSISPNTFTCALLGPNLVLFTVTDKSGNTDVCPTFVDIQDKDSICPTNVYSTASITGAIMTPQSKGVDKVDIMMNGAFSQVSTTNTGNYTLIKPMGMNYMVKPEKKGDDLNGVTTFDVVRMTRHILGLDRITDPYTLIAADVNKNGTISSADIVATRRVILGLTPVFAPNQQSWRFVRKDFVFSNPLNPFSAPFPEYSIVSLTGDQTSNFVAVKIGDLNNSVKPSSNSPAGQRENTESLHIHADNIQMEAGKTYRIPLSIREKDLGGMQFTLKLNDKVELLNIAPGDLPEIGASNIAVLDNNTITASWNTSQLLNGQSLFAVLELRASDNVNLSEVLALNSEVTPAEGYSNDDEIRNVRLKIGDGKASSASDNVELYQNQPNPFSESTQIRFYLPEPTEATLLVTDVNGKVVYRQKNEYDRGTHSINLNKNEMPTLTTGILYYQLQTPGQSKTGKMIILD